jgi:hypothetical protein
MNAIFGHTSVADPHLDANPDPDPNPTVASKYRLKTLKKCSNRLIHIPYILHCHLKIDADPDQTFNLMRINANPDVDPQHCPNHT